LVNKGRKNQIKLTKGAKGINKEVLIFQGFQDIAQSEKTSKM